MNKTIQVAKGVEVPYLFTLEALESFCVDTSTALTDIYGVLSSSRGQFTAINSLLYHIVKAGYADLGVEMPYTRDDVKVWLTGKKRPVNLVLLNAVVMIAASVLLATEDEEDEVEDVEKN